MLLDALNWAVTGGLETAEIHSSDWETADFGPQMCVNIRGQRGSVSQVKNWNILLNPVLLDVDSATFFFIIFYTKLLINVI